MAKFKRIEQKQTSTRREHYENALTLNRLKARPKKLSFVEIKLGQGEDGSPSETANIYFLPIPAAAVLGLRDPALKPIEVVDKMIDLVAEYVVDPFTSEPLMSADGWRKEDYDFLNDVIGAVTGLQLVVEGEEVDESEVIEVNIEELASDPNPLDETVGSDSPTNSTGNSNQDKETFNAG